ncbi:MAG: proline dehydrogenase family protein [Saprospiraceae bacterium]|jgi:proline dehydrogenase|nr:proline dehydrogenase family protein [Saprospiraceae bacterium]
MSDPDPTYHLDFSNTEIAFSHKSDKELKKTAWLFGLMNNNTLVRIFSKFGLFAIRFRLPFTEMIVRNTIFPQFCGGESLLDSQQVIDKLYESDTLTVLDYGAEGKSDEDDLDAAMEETLRAIEMAASNNSVPVVSTKITGLVDNQILEKMHTGEILTDGEKRKFQHLTERVDEICTRANELGISVFVDAEESWMQDPIDELVLQMMVKYNRDRAVVYNTYQLYLTCKLEHLKRDHQRCMEHHVIFGAKMVRGAYMDKERERARELGIPSPIQPDKASTDSDYNLALTYCIDHFETISSCCASHNAESNLLQAKLVHEKDIEHNHPHINFCQLYGMSDNITFNLASAGYNAAKYVVYGPIREVIPYLIRRTEENTSVTGEMSRELALVHKEMKRRELN